MNHREYGWIELADLVSGHIGDLQHRPTEWLCRAKEQLGWRIDTFRAAPPQTEEATRLMVRLIDRRNVIEAEVDARLARTLTDLPDLSELYRLGYRQAGRAL